MKDAVDMETGCAGVQKSALRTDYGIYPWLVLALLTGVQSLHSSVTMSVGFLAPFIITDLGLNKAMIGFAGGAASLGVSITVILAGRLADTRGEKAIMVTSSILTGLAIMLASQANNFPLLVLLLLLTGSFSSAPTPAGSIALSKWFPPVRLGFALGIRQTGIPLGGVLGATLLPPLAILWGWRAAMIAAGMALVMGGLICLATYQDHPRTVNKGTDGKAKAKIDWSFLRSLDIWLCILVASVFIGAQYVLLTYLSLYIHEQAGFEVTNALRFVAISQVGGIVARISLGFLSDTVWKGARKPALTLAGILMIISTLSLLLLGRGSPGWLVAVVSLLFGMSAMGWNAIFVALVMKMGGKEQGGTVLGFYLSVMQSGILIFPPLFGYVIDLTGTYRYSWLAMSLLIVLATILVQKIREPAAS